MILNRSALMPLALALVLGACSGSDGYGLGNGSDNNAESGGGGGGETPIRDEDDEGGDEEALDGSSSVAFRNLSVFESSDTFSGVGIGGLYQGFTDVSYIVSYPILPVDATTLAPIATATEDEYVTTVDGVAIDKEESFPKLQRVLGVSTNLRTALVFDLSDSTRDGDMAALVREAKDYITAAQASTNDIIANQEYVVWAFGSSVLNVTGDFTSSAVDLFADLDTVETLDATRALGPVSNLHRAVVEATGRYTDATYSFGTDGDNDLFDSVGPDYIQLSQMVVFSSGNESFLEFSQESMVSAIESQGLALAGDNADSPDFIYKPVFYYVLGGNVEGETYAALSANAERTRDLVLESGEYEFADQLITDQVAAFNARVNPDNHFVYRYAFLPRIGDHTSVFQSNTSGANSSLTTAWPAASLNPAIGVPRDTLATLVEITGPNGEFLAGNRASLAEVDTFAPATRWVTETYDPVTDYSWSIVSGSATLVNNADGTVTLSAITASPVVLQLRNLAIGDVETIQVVN